MGKFFLAAALTAVLFLSGCTGYSGTDWRGLFEKQAKEKVEIEGYTGGAMPYPEQIYNADEIRGYLMNAPLGKQKTGVPLILKEQINCPSKHVKIRGEILKRGVQPMGSDFIELLDWLMIKVDGFECLPQ